MMTLIEAIKKNNQTEFFRLLNLKTDPSGKKVIDEIDAENGGNPLHVAIAYGHLHFVTPLIEAGIDVNEPDNDGWTPVYIAADNGYAEIITALKAAGADMDKPNNDDVTPIYVATENEHTAAIIALGTAGAKMDTLDNNGFTPLCMAVKVGDVAVVSALLEAGANANIKTPRGTPLEGAQKGTGPGHPEVVRLLETHLKQYPNGIMTRNVNTVTHSGSRLETKEQSEISGQKLQATLPHSRNTTEFNPRSRTDDNSAPKVVIVHSGSKTQADEDLQKFSAVINGQDDYWIEQNNHKGLPKGIQALQKAMNAQNYSLGALIAEAKKWRKPTFLYKPEPCLHPLYQIFLDAEQGKLTEVRQGLSALTRAQRQYQQSTELKTKLQTNQMHLAQALSAKNNLMIAEAYQERGLLYLDTDKIRYSSQALESFSQALTLEASASLTAFCLRKRASLYLAQGKTIEGINDLREACGWTLDNPQAWLEYGEALISLERHKEAIFPLKKALVLRPEHYRTQTLLKEAISQGQLPVGALENIELLLASGYTLETINARTVERGELPLWLKAAQLGDSAAIQYLAPQLDTQVRDRVGNTALHYAARFGRAPLMRLLSQTMDLNTRNNYGATPLYLAAEYGQSGVILSLKSLGANVDIPDYEGLTPIYSAVFNGHAAAVAALLKAGADASIKTGLGAALEQAKISKGQGYAEVVTLLEAHFKQYPNGIKPKETKQEAQHVTEKLPNSLHQALAEERKDKAEMKQKLEQLASAFSLLAAKTTANRRGSHPINLRDKKDEAEKLRTVLEELRTFFIEERDIGEKTENYALYNEYLKKMNNGMQFAYKATQNRHVLYVNGKPLEGTQLATEEISKMIASLDCSPHGVR